MVWPLLLKSVCLSACLPICLLGGFYACLRDIKLYKEGEILMILHILRSITLCFLSFMVRNAEKKLFKILFYPPKLMGF